jgi:hypothetical protein
MEGIAMKCSFSKRASDFAISKVMNTSLPNFNDKNFRSKE